MEKLYKTSLFLFRRDLRIEDNRGLIFALQSSERVLPAFIFTPDQIEENPYRSDHALRFMIESLVDLEEQLKGAGGTLYFFFGKPEAIVRQMIDQLQIEALIVNRDYTPYSRQRDEAIKIVCQTHQIPFYSLDDALLLPPEKSVNEGNKPYRIFTPYFRNASRQKIDPPLHYAASNYFREKIPFAKNRSLLRRLLPDHVVHRGLKGGRREALDILKKLPLFAEYETLRKFPEKQGSTHLSPYLKFTVCSPREVYEAICLALGADHPLIRSLYWRDFFTTIGFFFPHVFRGSFHPKFDSLNWTYDQENYLRWCEGNTGFPIIDAGMRELKATGFLQNQLRMITASFLVKDLHMNWRLGEKQFANNLVDYDPAINNGNWQWIASTGSDAQPYFRTFNPWIQQKKIDADCRYIKQWIPELQDLPPQRIHTWHKETKATSGYPAPMTDHRRAIQRTLQIYKSASVGPNRDRES